MRGLGAVLMLVAAMSVSARAMASEAFFGFQYNLMHIQGAGADALWLQGRTLRGGLAVTPSVDLEVRLGKGFGDDEDQGVEAENRFHGGVHGLYRQPLGPVTGYALAGYSYAETDLNRQRHYETGLSYGAGLDWTVFEGVALNLEYLRLGESDGARQGLLAGGVTFRF